MFESVVPETFQARSRRLLYETLPLSIALHAAVIAAVLVNMMWTVVFPSHSPALVSAYTLADLPEPPPPPPVPVAPAPKPVAQTNAPPPPPPPQLLEVAPRVIPNMIPRVVAIEVPPAPPVTNTVAAAVDGSPEGVEGGKSGGKIGGQLGGQLGGVVGGIVFPDDGRVYVERDAKLPLVPVQQDYPHYPDEAKRLRLEDSVLVRYVIGTDGRVKDVTILDHARNPMFDEPTVKAISDWRFQPYKKNGKRVEVVHELTVFYQMVFR